MVFLLFNFSHNTKLELPPDLDKEKIIFLRYELMPEPTYSNGLKGLLEKKAAWYIRKYNIQVPVLNIKLEESAKNYPFEYKIIDKSELNEYKAKGYKYIFEEITRLGTKYELEEHKNTYDLTQKSRSYYTTKSVKALISDVYIKNLITDELYLIYKDKSYLLPVSLKDISQKIRKKYQVK